MKKKIYISGKIKDLPRKECENKFSTIEKFLDNQGFTPINPLKFKQTSPHWGDRILYDLNVLKECDGIWMLDNWKNDSNGAMVEYYFAKGCGIKIMGPYA